MEPTDPKNMTFNQLLYEATMEVFEGLGEETMQALVWQMGTKGVRFAPDSFDIKVFAVELRELLGDGADSLFEEIYQNVICRLELFLTSIDDSSNEFVNKGMRLAALQELQTLFGGVRDGYEDETR
ncbi:MAG TPA: hypothetical protein VJZ68_03535 [Nitrososphaera sp.]|nr:hypothetical protein [Nitrososphaera sp.]